MPNFNKVLLMGNLTRDPELRYSGGGQAGQGGSAICKFGLAVNRSWRDPSNQLHEETTFVDITVFGRQAETCNEFLKKGRPVFVEGRLNFSTWEDRESGQKRSKLDVVAERVQFLGSRDGGGGPREGDEAGGAEGGGWGGRPARSGGGGGGGAPRGGGRPAPAGGPQGAPGNSGGGASPGGATGGAAGSDGVDFDDIPF